MTFDFKVLGNIFSISIRIYNKLFIAKFFFTTQLMQASIQGRGIKCLRY